MVEPMNWLKGLNRRLGIIAAATFLVFTGALGPAHADATTRQESALPFAAQASSLGLTASQSRNLQDRVGWYLDRMNGTQVAVNKIALEQGGFVLLTLPGEKRARDLTVGGKSAPANAPRSPGEGMGSVDCWAYYFCAYSEKFYFGDQIFMFNCRDYAIPWLYYGSWDNNQVGRTQALFKDNQGIIRWVSPPSRVWDPQADWYWVHWVKPC